jgi:hypothetical protein
MTESRIGWSRETGQHGVSNGNVFCTEFVDYSGKKATSGQVKRWSQLASSVWDREQAPEWTARRVKGEASPAEVRVGTSDKGGNGLMDEESEV